MAMPVELKARRWLTRRVERQARRRLKAPSPPARPRFVAVASLVDGYCECLGPAGNDDGVRVRRPAGGPPLALVRG